MRIDIYGLGAIGSNLLVQLVKQYPEFNYGGVDFDVVEDRNLRTQAYFLEHVPLPKVLAMQGALRRFVRKPNYQPRKEKIESSAQVSGADLIIDCFDNTASRKVFKACRGNILHIGFSPFYTAECIWNEDYEVPNDVDARRADICSMTEAVAFIHFIVNAALLNIADFLQSGRKRNFIITGKNKIQWL